MGLIQVNCHYISSEKSAYLDNMTGRRHVNKVRDTVTKPTLTKEKLTNDFADVSTGTALQESKYQLELELDAKPVMHSLRRVSTKNLLKYELKKMTEDKIFQPVSEPTQGYRALQPSKTR